MEYHARPGRYLRDERGVRPAYIFFFFFAFFAFFL
jgi:hypothetical protein